MVTIGPNEAARRTLSAKYRIVNEADEILQKYVSPEKQQEIARAHPNFDRQLELLHQAFEDMDAGNLTNLFTTGYRQEIEVFFNLNLEQFPDIQMQKSQEGIDIEPLSDAELEQIQQKGGFGIPFTIKDESGKARKISDKELVQFQTQFYKEGKLQKADNQFTLYKKTIKEEQREYLRASWAPRENEFIKSRLEQGKMPSEIFKDYRKWGMERGVFPRTKGSIISKIGRVKYPKV